MSKTIKTYLGQTAGGILKTARIVKMDAGNTEIVVTTKDGREHLASLGGRTGFDGGVICDAMILRNFDGLAAVLETSVAAYNKLRALENHAQ